MRFLHAADVHLDSPLRGLEKYEGAPVDVLRGATRKALAALVRLAIEKRVDFVILAGDLYDGDWPDYNTGLFFIQRMRELEKAGIPVYLIRGNHDAESRITATLTLPPNVHSFSTEKAETRLIEPLRVALHGQGFANQAEPRNLAANYPAAVPNHFNIGLLHTSLDGREGHASYAPCQLTDLVGRDYDYWALGHVHQRESVNQANRPRIEFPGNVQGRHARETGAKGCMLVAVDGAQVSTEFCPLDVLRWQVVNVDATTAESWSELLEQVRASLSAAVDEADGRLLAARVEILCPDSLQQLIAGDLPRFRFDLYGLFAQQVWIEKIHWKRVPRPAAELTFSDDATSELQAVLAEVRANPETSQQQLATGECEKLFKSLPAELRTILEKSWPEIVTRAEQLLQASGQEGRA